MAPHLLLAGLATMLAVSGCGGGDASKTAAKPERSLLERIDTRPAKVTGEDEEVRKLLSDRARALEAHDAAALAATATGAQRARDRRAARRTTRMSIERIHFVPEDLRMEGDRARITVTMSYLVRGMSRPFVTPRRVTARRTPAGWRISSDVPRRERLPWEVAAFRVTRAPHVVLLTPPGVDPDRLRPGLTAAYREIRRDLPSRDLPRSVLVIAARDAPQTEQLIGRIGSRIVALADVVVRWGYPPAFPVKRVIAQRMIVVVARWGRMPESERQMTLAHEMTHTTLNSDTSARTPAWLLEGVAMLVSNEDRTAEARARAAGAGPTMRLRAISKPGSMMRLNGSRQIAAYVASSAAAEAIAARHGTKGLLRFYDAFNDPTIKGRPGARTTDRVLRRTLGMSLAELQAEIGG